jgi:hypothetical protein
MVETIWTKLHAPHAVIEPVSETRARNGIYCGRDRAAKWAHSPRANVRWNTCLGQFRVQVGHAQDLIA